MKLFNILNKIDSKIEIINNNNFIVKGISLSSKKMADNFIFGAFKGNKFNGEDYIDEIQKLRNIAIIISKDSAFKIDSKKYKKIVFIKVNNIKFFIGEICQIFFPNKIKAKYAVTGTNGKTSVSSYVFQIWDMQKINGACIGTLGLTTKTKKSFDYDSNLTTPDIIDTHKILNQLDKYGCKKVIFEASSIGLDQKRLHPLKFDIIAFTNLSRDHLDYHKTLENYKLSKSILFKNHIKKNSLAVINTDSKYSEFFIDVCVMKKIKILDYGVNGNFVKIKSIRQLKNKIEIQILFKKKLITLQTNCSSNFEVYNRICSLIIAYNKSLNFNHFNLISNLKNPDGRIEKIYDRKKIKVFIDYAHTPDAISKVLSALRKITAGRLILVFGCGGDRDKTKRSQMTQNAIKFSDLVIITDDNPRFEDPKKIKDDMIRGIKPTSLNKIKIIYNRYNAIETAINLLKENDILIIAGKGHENYQIIKDKKINFSDKKVAREFLKKK